MKFETMVHVDSATHGPQQIEATDRCGHLHGLSCEDQAEVFKKQLQQEANDSIPMDENSIFSRRRKSGASLQEVQNLSESKQSDGITLYPFVHQVGGHRQLLTLDKSTLCKPLVPRELLFYLNVPKELLNFVPAYKGVVQISEISPGNYQPIVHQPIRVSQNNLSAPFREIKSPNKDRETQSSTKCTINTSNCSDFNGINSNTLPRAKQTPAPFPFELRVQLRPFSDEKMLKKNLSQENLLRADYITRPNEKYLLLLENVASKYQLPCILDLKMGTRQHDDDASEEKRFRQIAKCQASTSASLGVRLCGMQVYQVDYGGYLWYDKYYGRRMDQDGLKCALREYFQHGSKSRLQNKTNLICLIIDEIIERLKRLYEAVDKSPSFRFYGTSLLIIHESCQILEESNTPISIGTPGGQPESRLNSENGPISPVDVRLIDFAHTICDLPNATTATIPTPTARSGLRAYSSPSIFRSSSADQISSMTASHMDIIDERNNYEVTQIEEETEAQCERVGSDQDNLDELATTAMNDTDETSHRVPEGQLDSNQATDDETVPPSSKQPLGSTKSSPTGVMDTTRPKQLPSAKSNARKISRSSSGPDRGLLFGLENLMKLLNDLKSEILSG